MSNQATAILLFSRTAAAEAQSKGFGTGIAGDERLANRLISQTRSTLAKTGLPVYRSDEASQQGATFGERLANAMAAVYALGYERLLVVGNDCPLIRAAHLRAAAQMLAQGKNVLGPDRRGGIWLLGLQRKDFAPQQLAELSWQSAAVYAQLSAWLPRLAAAASLVDLNTVLNLRSQWFLLRRFFGDLVDLVFAIRLSNFYFLDSRAVKVTIRLAGRAPPSHSYRRF